MTGLSDKNKNNVSSVMALVTVFVFSVLEHVLCLFALFSAFLFMETHFLMFEFRDSYHVVRMVDSVS